MTLCEPAPVTQTVLERIESFMNDSAYQEMLENSSRYNARLSAERRIRLPFVDHHTGVAQTHTDLFKHSRQRMPGINHSQVYTYPSKRWCKRRRQYLMTSTNGRRMDREDDNSNTGDNILLNEDSKDSSGLKDEVSKEQWYYEDEMMEMDAFEEHDIDSDYDYDDHYRSGRKKKRPTKSTSRSRGTSRTAAANSPKGAGGTNNRRRGPSAGGGGPPPTQQLAPQPPPPKLPPKDDKPSSPATNKLPDTPEMDPYKNMALSDDKARVAPSPYCDFCLGDSAENRKTSIPEDLVSCSDCGRSGHPSCLQFTPNMIRSVRKYRWQCIECKCCSICGTSDNDDQLLFCDDCDRGYHMYCLAPPLTSPPEGSWSCGLCLVEFHRRGK